jgi:hypothetical protein
VGQVLTCPTASLASFPVKCKDAGAAKEADKSDGSRYRVIG